MTRRYKNRKRVARGVVGEEHKEVADHVGSCGPL